MKIRAANKRKFKILFGIFFFSLCFVIIFAASIIESTLINNERMVVHNTLQAIGQLKSDEVALWYKERRGDAKVIYRSQLLAKAIYDYQILENNELKNIILDHMIDLMENYQYFSVFITDTSGNVILSKNKNDQVYPVELSAFSKAVDTNNIYFSDIHKANTDYFNGQEMDIIIQINIDLSHESKVIAAVFIRVNINKTIYPIIEKWPYPSKSGESLLVRRDDDDVLFLTKLRFKNVEALDYRIPMSKEHLPAALALKGFTGVLIGNDYRGVEVLASANKVEGTNWAIIAKVDADEIYQPLRSTTNLALSITIVFISILFLSFYFWWNSLTNRIKAGHLKSLLDRKALEKHFEFLSKHANDIILLADDNWKIIEVNDKAINSYQYSRDELIGFQVTELEANDVSTVNEEKFKNSFHDGFIFEDNHQRKDGSVFQVEISLRTIEKQGENYRQLIIRDITQRKKREIQLQLSEQIVESSNEMIALINREFIYLKVNKAYAEVFNKKPEEIIGHTMVENLGQELFEEFVKPNSEMCLKGKNVRYVHRFDFPSIKEQDLDISYSPYYDDKKNIVGFVVNARNITDLVITEERLHETNARLQSADEDFRRSEAQLQTVIKAGSLGFWHLDLEEDKHIVNDIWLDILGLSREDIDEKGSDFDKRIHPDDAAYLTKFFIENISNDNTMTVEYRLRHKDGHYVWVEDRFAIVDREADTRKPLYLSGVTRDISERKNTQMELQNTYNALKALSACNEVLVRSDNEKDLIQNICNTIASMDHYTASWVGLVTDKDKKHFEPVAQNGLDLGNFRLNENIDITKTPFYKVVESGELLILENVDTEEIVNFILCFDNSEYQYKSLIILPLILDEEVIGCISILTDHEHHFTDDEISLLQEMAGDMAFGIDALRVSSENENISKTLSDSLIKTIEAIAITVEKRDPYTAGHMNHVAKLSSCIAKEMGLSGEQIQGIELGATIHDIGKIYIPAEILNRPGKLSKAEFEMIQSHSQVGYDIVKGINFSWPVADMILQHHEKLDGSGYPNGLKGDEIIIEAQIIAVADVIEAISSHRPYRPALGIEAGLDVIKEGRGTLFNAEAVDVCVKLVEEGFEFDN